MTSPGLRCGAPERAVVVVGLLCPPQSLLGGVDAAGLQAVVIGHVARKPHEYKGRSGTVPVQLHCHQWRHLHVSL